MVSRSKHGIIYMWSDDTTELRHCICEPDADARGHGSFQRPNSFRPDDRIRRTRASNCDNEEDVLDDRVGDREEDNIRDHNGRFS